MLQVYPGRSDGNTIRLPEGVSIPRGSKVEVRVYDPAQGNEDLFQQNLLQMGLLSELKSSSTPLPQEDREPISVDGQPLSEMIIEERR